MPLLGSGYSRISPSSVRRPIWLAVISVNHRASSDPRAIPNGPLSAVGTSNELTSPEIVIRPMRLLRDSVNHKARSGPGVMTDGPQVAGSS
jgi:hypothetical protein